VEKKARHRREDRETEKRQPPSLSLSLSLSLRDTDAPRKTRTWLGQLTTVSWKACGAAMSFLG